MDMEVVEIINKGLKKPKAITVRIGNACIFNVLVPCEETRLKYKSIARKILKKCGLRSRLTYYPIPPEVARKKEMVPYYFVCLAKYKKMKELN